MNKIMNAKEALILSKRKINPDIVNTIIEAAERGETETEITNLECEGLSLTRNDKLWLIMNGYKYFIKNEHVEPYGICDIEYISWTDAFIIEDKTIKELTNG